MNSDLSPQERKKRITEGLYRERVARVVMKDGKPVVEVPLTQGKVALVDVGDWPKVNSYTWYAVFQHERWYAQTTPKGATPRSAKLKMHRLVLDAGPNQIIDHHSGDGLDNRRSNLRFASNAENQANTRGRRGSSRFKGVSWNKAKARWLVRTSHDGKKVFDGYFDEEVEAARAADDLMSRLHGLFARLNFPRSDVPSSSQIATLPIP